jgi:ferrous iron transport protein B
LIAVGSKEITNILDEGGLTMEDDVTKQTVTIGLLGQSNIGKAALFNSLTGAKQHVSNWSDKTGELKNGLYQDEEYIYRLVDLPGTDSLTTNSDQALVAKEFIIFGKVRVILVLIDVSQLKRSMYLLADYAGINIPTVAVFNMIDVAVPNGKQIDFKRIEAKLGIPVVVMADTTEDFKRQLLMGLARAISNEGIINTRVIEQKYRKAFSITFDMLLNNLPEGGIENVSAMWLVVKLLEGDARIGQLVRDTVAVNQWRAIRAAVAQHQTGANVTTGCKYEWINEIV